MMNEQLQVIPHRLLVMDRDGTLVGTCEANLQAYSRALRELSLPTPPNLAELLHQGLSWASIAGRIFPNMSEATARDVHSMKAEHFGKYLDLLNWNEKLLKMLNGHEWAVVSNGSKRSTLQIFKHRPELKPMVIIGPTENLKPKPAPDMYFYLMKKYNLVPSEIIVYEDSEIGMKSAEDAGLQVIAVQHRC